MRASVIAASGVLAASGQMWPPATPACAQEAWRGARFCDASLATSERVGALLEVLTLDEKVACTSTKSCHVPRLGLAMTWKEALHGVRYNCLRDLGDGTPLCATSFPHAQLLAASFNRSLWSAVGQSISAEARAFHNLYSTGRSKHAWSALSFFTPDVNLCRDPRWGRCLEVPGEDPFLSAEFGVQYVKAMQEQDQRGFHKTLCNAKHFSSYDVEMGRTSEGKGEPYHRLNLDAKITNRDLVETYLPHFRTIVRGAGLSGVMCSYNAVNGIPSCANDLLTNKVLRGPEFGFDGMVVSDCGAVGGIGPAQHNYTKGGKPVVAAALSGGTDLNCGTYFDRFLNKSLQAGVVSKAQLDMAATRTLSQLVKVGLLEAQAPWSAYGAGDIDSEAHRRLAFDAAVSGMVLLKNEGDLLPLKKGTRVAVLGPHFNASGAFLANYHGENMLVSNHTPLLSLLRRSDVEVVAAVAGSSLSGDDRSGYAEAAAAAMDADVALVFVGLSAEETNISEATEKENLDRTFVTLPSVQEGLLEAVLATKTSVVMVQVNAGGLDTVGYERCGAVLEAFYSGEFGGDAIASVLLGDVSPAGRLPNTIYRGAYTAARNITDMEMRRHHGVPGITHRFLSDADRQEFVRFPFGYGQTYSTFDFAVTDGELSTTTDALLRAWNASFVGQVSGLPTFDVRVTNTGKARSDVVVLGFLSKQLDASAPVEDLFGFERIGNLVPGASAMVALTVQPRSLTVVTADGVEMLSAGTYSIAFGGEPDGFARAQLIVTEEPKVVFQLPSDDGEELLV